MNGITAHLNPTPHRRALATQIALADELCREGFAVWQNLGLRRHDLEFPQAFGESKDSLLSALIESHACQTDLQEPAHAAQERDQRRDSVRDKTLDDYHGDRLLRQAIERIFEIIGEAIN